MGVTAALVLYAVIWFMVLFVTLPIRLTTQGDTGEIVPGTQAGAPVNPQLKRRFLIVTAVSLVLWAVIAGIIITGAITICDFDWAGTMDETCSARAGDA
jgi:predicted secreted protein